MNNKEAIVLAQKDHLLTAQADLLLAKHAAFKDFHNPRTWQDFEDAALAQERVSRAYYEAWCTINLPPKSRAINPLAIGACCLLLAIWIFTWVSLWN